MCVARAQVLGHFLLSSQARQPGARWEAESLGFKLELQEGMLALQVAAYSAVPQNLPFNIFV